MAAQAKLMAALKKKADDDDAPRPDLTPIVPTSDDRQTVKLRNTKLLGVVTWEQAIEKLLLNLKHDFAELAATVHKMFGNVLANPGEQKFRKVRYSNPNFVSKVWSSKGGAEIFEVFICLSLHFSLSLSPCLAASLDVQEHFDTEMRERERLGGTHTHIPLYGVYTQVAGWKKDTIEAGFLVLPEGADLALLQRAIDALTAQTEERAATEEKKRKLDAEAAKKGREARAQKVAEKANLSAYDAAAASSMIVDEDEAMVEAIHDYMQGHKEVCADVPGCFDHFEIESQVTGPGATVIASVAASSGTKYYDLVAHMKRSEGGRWIVSKVKVGS
jgi:hypothetical protein